MHRHTKATAYILLWTVFAPSGLIAIASSAVIPWLIKTRDRLDNDYWESQILYAIIALSAICLVLPLIVIRVAGWLEGLSNLIWVLIIAAYSLIMLYMIQSHFPLISKIVVSAFSLLMMALSYAGLCYESKEANKMI